MSGSERWHLAHLDALRGIAVFGVLMVHAWYWGGQMVVLKPSLLYVASSGQRGVQLFFIVSAFTLCLSHDQRRAEPSPLRNFYIRRVFRIAPMFWVGALLTWWTLPTEFGTWAQAWPSFLLMHGLSANTIMHGPAGGWSVADEALFYVCFPILVRVLDSFDAAVRWLGIAMPLGYLGCWALGSWFPGARQFWTFLSFPVELPVFLMGFFAYRLWKEYGRPSRSISAALLVATVLFYIGLLPLTNSRLYPTSAVCLLLLLSLSFWPWPLLVNRWTCWLGRISYSVYLVHFATFHLIQRYLDTLPISSTTKFFASLLIGLVVTAPISYVTWRWIEEPGIQAGRRLIRRLSRASARAYAVSAGTPS